MENLHEHAHEFDGFAKIKSADETEFFRIGIKVRRDSQIPEFDAIEDLKWEVCGFEGQEKYTAVVIQMATEYGGMFISDVMKLEDRDIMSMAGEEVRFDNVVVVQALRALKKAVCNYFENTGQNDRLKRATEKLICRCHHVTDYDIKDAVERGKKSFEEVSRFTGAGTGCNSCVRKVKELVIKFNE